LRLTFVDHEDPELLLAPPVVKPAADAAETGPAAARSGTEEGDVPSEGTAPPQPAEGETCAPFQNEPHADFSREANRVAMEKALGTIAGSAGRDYPLLIDGSPVQTGAWLTSVNPARPSQVVGRVAAASKDEADRALDSAVGAFHFWRDTPAGERADVLFKAAPPCGRGVSAGCAGGHGGGQALAGSGRRCLVRLSISSNIAGGDAGGCRMVTSSATCRARAIFTSTSRGAWPVVIAPELPGLAI
jgi:hypothetical protein